MTKSGSEATQFKSFGQGIGGERPLSFKVPAKYLEVLTALPNRSKKIREWVIEGMIRDGLIQD